MGRGIFRIGYTELEYIQSSGTQYIDTGFIPDQDTRVTAYCKAGQKTPDETSSAVVFGVRKSQGVDQYAFYISPTGLYASSYGGHNNAINGVPLFEDPFVVDKNKNVVTIQSHVYQNNYSNPFTCPASLFLFSRNNNGKTDCFCIADLYSCQIYDNGTLVRDYVPCKNPTGEVGLYDLVNSQFYGNAGTGVFEAGPEVNPLVSTDAEYAFAVSGARDLVGVFEEEQGNG